MYVYIYMYIYIYVIYIYTYIHMYMYIYMERMRDHGATDDVIVYGHARMLSSWCCPGAQVARAGEDGCAARGHRGP